ncbi:MAG TPA: EamA family transporter [Ilumatobacteraceae bacterium]|nr:EamA family transporter [Ilumatobacteraceae bacterium]
MTDLRPPARSGPLTNWLNTAQPEALFVLSAIAQYIGAVIAVGLFDQVEPRTVAWFRVIGAALAVVVVSRPWRQRWTRSDLLAAAAFGIATALMNLFFYLAIDRIDLGKAVTIEFIGPIAVAAVATRSIRNAVALLFAIAGVVVLGGGEVEGNAIGLLFIFLASAMWAVYIVIGSRVARLDRGVAGLGVGLAIGALAITPVGAPGSGDVWTSPSLLALCLLVGVFSNAIGYGIDQFTMRRIPIRRFSLLLALLPVTAAFIGWLVLDQRPSTLEMLGIAFVLVGVMVQERDELAPIEAEVLTEPS